MWWPKASAASLVMTSCSVRWTMPPSCQTHCGYNRAFTENNLKHATGSQRLRFMPKRLWQCAGQSRECQTDGRTARAETHMHGCCDRLPTMPEVGSVSASSYKGRATSSTSRQGAFQGRGAGGKSSGLDGSVLEFGKSHSQRAEVARQRLSTAGGFQTCAHGSRPQKKESSLNWCFSHAPSQSPKIGIQILKS